MNRLSATFDADTSRLIRLEVYPWIDLDASETFDAKVLEATAEDLVHREGYSNPIATESYWDLRTDGLRLVRIVNVQAEKPNGGGVTMYATVNAHSGELEAITGPTVAKDHQVNDRLHVADLPIHVEIAVLASIAAVFAAVAGQRGCRRGS